MISQIVIPNLGATGGDVILEAWLVQPGQFVQAGAPLFVVTTDKATVEVEAFRSGYLLRRLAEPGSCLPIGAPVALIADSPEEKLADHKVVPELPARPAVGVTPARPAQTGARRLSSPLARRIAGQIGLDLATISGSGPGGAILKRDVLEAARSAQNAEQIMEAEVDQDISRRLPVSSMRRSIARQTVLSKREIPHFYASTTIDMSAARDLLEQTTRLAEKKGWAVPTITDLILRAVALSLADTPQLNASYQGDEILVYREINIGLVVGLTEGMIVPVLHNVDQKNLFRIAEATRRLKERAESGTLSGTELSGATFTLSNLGMFGLDSFTAVINPPQAGILAVGAIRQAPAAWQGQVALRWLMTANLSVDHRVVDGARAAQFMEGLRFLLENPASLTLEPPQENRI